ncbi:MAG TPA: BMC domain-containing protein [Patescibacteria group bacterium]|nr:BMC domain-containing protein [Patescibacteria group bacterium]
MGKSIGVLEVYGTSNGFEAAEACYQAKEITIESLEIGRIRHFPGEKSGILVRVAVRGSLVAVEAAVSKGVKIALKTADLRYHQILSDPVSDAGSV